MYENLVEIRRNSDYTTENFLDYLYHQKHKFIVIDLSKHTNTGIPQQVNFIGKLEEGHGATMFLIDK